jgi:two-component system LytT family response regulator
MSGKTLDASWKAPRESRSSSRAQATPGHGVSASRGVVRRSTYLVRIPLRCHFEVFLVPVSQVAAIVADGEKLIITTVGQRQYVIHYRLKDLETRLDPEQFVRLSRGALVNVSAVSRIVVRPNSTNTVILEGGQELSMSRIQARRLRNTLLQLS